MTERFTWGNNNVLWLRVAPETTPMVVGWVGYRVEDQTWYARTAGSLVHPVTRAVFDNPDAARDFLLFICNMEHPQ